MLDPTIYKDWQIAEDAEQRLPSIDYFREKMGLLPEEIIPYGRTPKLDFLKIMERLKDRPDGKYIAWIGDASGETEIYLYDVAAGGEPGRHGEQPGHDGGDGDLFHRGLHL